MNPPPQPDDAKTPCYAAKSGWRSNLKYPFSLHCAGMLLGRQNFVPSMAMTTPEGLTGCVQLCHPSCQGSGVPLQPLSCPRVQMLPGASGAGQKHPPSGTLAWMHSGSLSCPPICGCGWMQGYSQASSQTRTLHPASRISKPFWFSL